MQDQGFKGGVAAEFEEKHQFPLPNMEMYHTERFGQNAGFKYEVPLEEDGTYTLVLKFSEVYFQEPGQKIFDVKLGNTKVVSDLDIFGKVYSRGIPYDEFVEFQVKGGKVVYKGSEVSGALTNGKLQVDFAVGRADNPKLNALLLVKGPKSLTHYDNFRKYLKALEDIKDQQ